MIFEWILENNNLKQPNAMMSFKAKVNILNANLDALFPQNLPSFFSGDINLINTIVLVYGKFRVLRNAIIHGGWGRSVCGDLDFDFELQDSPTNPDPYFPNGRTQYFLDFENVCDFASVVSIIVDELVGNASPQSLKIYNIQYLLDKLHPVHAGHQFQVNSPPQYCDIEYISRIDLGGVFSINLPHLLSVAKQIYPNIIYYTLKISERSREYNPYSIGIDPKETPNSDKIINTWEIPCNEIDDSRNFLFDPYNHRWLNHKLI